VDMLAFYKKYKAHFLKQKLQNCFSLHGDKLAYICTDAFCWVRIASSTWNVSWYN